MADLITMLSACGATEGEATDAEFQNTVLLLHGDGTNGAQNNTFLDSSTNNFTITRNGNTTQGSFSPFSKPDGRWGNYFDGSGDYLTFTGNASTNFNGNDWCVETWVYMTKAPSTLAPIFNSTTGDGNWVPYLGLMIRANYKLAFFTNGSEYQSTETIGLNTWYHIAVVRSGGVIKVYLNGVATSISVTFDINNSNLSFWIGYIGPPAGVTEQLGGYLSNLRMVNGSAVYTSNFTPPTTPLTAITNTSLLTCQSNRFVDNSTNGFTLTRYGDVKVTPFSPFPITTAYSPAVNGGSGYFDGTGGGGSNTDSLTTPDDNSLDLGSSDFTLEAWIYPTANPTEAIRIVEREGNASNLSYLFLLLSDEKIGFNYSTNGTSYTQTSSSTSISLNTWTHVAITRSGSTFTFWINGVSSGTNTASVTIFNSNAVFRIGNTSSNDRCFPGYISDLRLVKGTAVYTTAFTPPTAPLTAIANTSLLTNFTNAGIFDNTGFNNLETVADAQIDTSVKKYGTGSMEFDGTGDVLLIPRPSDWQFGTENFTIEGWFYLAGAGSSGGFFTTRADTNVYAPVQIQFESGALKGYASTSGSAWAVDITSSTTPSATTWYHVAFVRNGGTFTLYLDGVSVGSTSGVTSALMTNVYGAVVGAQAANATNPLNGYIDDLRITKGVARYTTTFTPPTAAFPDIGE